MIITSHGINAIDNNNTNRFILFIEHGSGASADTVLQTLAISKILNILLLVTGASFWGDHAFHNSAFVIPPYSEIQLQAGNVIELGKFNHSHSSDRMSSEHGVKY